MGRWVATSVLVCGSLEPGGEFKHLAHPHAPLDSSASRGRGAICGRDKVGGHCVGEKDVLWTHLWQCFARKKIWNVTSSMPERVPRGKVSLYHRALSSVVWEVAIIPLYRCHPSKIVLAGRVSWAGCEGTRMLAGVPLLNLPPLARSIS